MNTTLDEWEDIRTRMKDVIDESSKDIWFENELIELYKLHHLS